MFKPARKRFGQNFLHDQNVISRIISSINPKHDEAFIEIGPGRGALTYELLKQLEQLHAIEIDRDLISWWQSQDIKNLTLHNIDALKVDYCQLIDSHPKKIRLLGNLPYNISTPLLFQLFKHRDCIQDMHFMLQKEVVERMTAQAGSKTYGRLSVMAQYHCQCIPLFNVSANSFTPIPKVESAIIRLIPHQTALVDVDETAFANTVRQAFSMRRKTIRNNLKKLLSSEQIQEIGIDPQTRAERLKLEDFALLARTAFPEA